ncbi:MAG: DUF3596 domain-containing protein [Bacteroidetes bacterium]|nr:DUF3596 domain-containing protein [Bacteroidota bacterium]
MGIKNPKGTVSIENFKDRVRLRWRYQGKRYTLSLFQYNKTNLKEGRKIAVKIEQDILYQQFDDSLKKYKNELEEIKLVENSIV